MVNKDGGYLSLYFDNLARTASMLEGLMDILDDETDPTEQALQSFQRLRVEIKTSVDERAATIRSLDSCVKELAARKEVMALKLKQLKNLQAKLKQKTLKSLAEFKNQPFRGDYCQLQANKTKGKIELNIHTSKVTLTNVIEPDVYGMTDIPTSCLNKVTYYYVKKDTLYKELSNGLAIKDAKIVENRALKIKDL